MERPKPLKCVAIPSLTGSMTELIEWNEWKPETFERARKADKLVLLDLSAVWCHWCHVMDETSYSDKGCAQVINEQFVPVKVWLDQRPDIGRSEEHTSELQSH